MNEGTTNWYECEGCGEVIDLKDVCYKDGGRYHWALTDVVDVGVGSGGIPRYEECGPVKVVSG